MRGPPQRDVIGHYRTLEPQAQGPEPSTQRRVRQCTSMTHESAPRAAPCRSTTVARGSPQLVGYRSHLTFSQTQNHRGMHSCAGEMDVLTRIRAGGRQIHFGLATTRHERAAAQARRFRVYQCRGYYRPGLHTDRDAYDTQRRAARQRSACHPASLGTGPATSISGSRRVSSELCIARLPNARLLETSAGTDEGDTEFSSAAELGIAATSASSPADREAPRSLTPTSDVIRAEATVN